MGVAAQAVTRGVMACDSVPHTNDAAEHIYCNLVTLDVLMGEGFGADSYFFCVVHGVVSFVTT